MKRTAVSDLLAVLILGFPFFAPQPQAGNVYVPLTIEEYAGADRIESPVASGVPLRQGKIFEQSNLQDLRVIDRSTGRAVPSQFTVQARWPDGSVKWVLADFQASVAAGNSAQYALTQDPYMPPEFPSYSLLVSSSGNTITVGTGTAVFEIPRQGFRLFESVQVGSTAVISPPGSSLVLTTGGVTYTTDQDASSYATPEEVDTMRAVIAVDGVYSDDLGNDSLSYQARLHFYAGKSYVRVFLTIGNHEAAIHPNNVWDLGSSGSRFINENTIILPLAVAGPYTYTAWTGSPTPLSSMMINSAALYQESSGGNRWDWNTHVNRFNVVPMTMQGYVFTDDSSPIENGDRPRGVFDLSGAQGGVAVTVRHFWQNFPKALRAQPGGTVEVSLFPIEFPDDHELQGGEEKTHEVLLYFHEGDAASAQVDAVMADLVSPLHARPAYEEVARTRILPAFGPKDTAAFPDYENTVEYIAFDKGDRSFFTQREMIDEYGWRNFGEAMADHETDCGTQCWDCPISHDNNQYDYNWAALLFWLRNGETEWFELGEQGTRHHMDIDVYHTDADVTVYNHGVFWHTTHDTHAYTSTHRTYSILMSPTCTPYLSGGPAIAHLYTDGILLYGYLTGDRRAFDVHRELEGYLTTRYGSDNSGAGSGYATRAWANALRTAVLAYQRNWDPAWYTQALQIVQDSDALSNPGVNGTVFGDSMLMKALGRFLDMKAERGELGDADAVGARSSLLELADRVRTNQPPQDDVLDFRYSEGLWYAYKYADQGDPEKLVWQSLGRDFFTAGTSGWFNAYITNKGLAHTATNGHQHTYFERGRIPDPVINLFAVKSADDVVLSWDAVSTDIDSNPITVDEYRVHRSALYPTRFTDVPLGTSAMVDYTAVGDVTGGERLYFYEVHAVADPGIEGY
ncbi:hypothetical protein ACFLU6_07850 [Acidobacteriota bacterium]